MSDTVLGDTVAQLVPNMAGSALRKARESTGMSIEDVATKLKLSPRQVAAIEAEDWQNLPERTFTRGFFYSYARLVGVEKRVIDTSFTQRAVALGEMRTLPPGKSEVTAENTSAPLGVSKWLIPILLLAALGGGIAWFLWKELPMPQASSKLSTNGAKSASPSTSDAKSNTPSELVAGKPDIIGQTSTISPPSIDAKNSVIAQQNEAIKIGAGGTSSTSSATSPSVAPPASTVLPTATSPAPSGATTPSVGATANPSNVPATAPAAPTNAAAVVPAKALAPGERRIVLTVNGRSWTEARGGGGALLSEMLNDTTREIVAKGPVSMVIGSSSNVKLTVDGKPYDFSMHVRNEVARFRIE